MSAAQVNGIRLSLAGASALPLAVTSRGSPSYDGPRNFFTVSLENVSTRRLTLPFDELRRNVVRVYRNPSTGAEITDNRTPPPKLDGSVEELAPGETKTFQVIFEYPARLATMEHGVALLHFCVKWESDWLRKSAYAASAYTWNEPFELCQEIRVLDR